MDTKCTRKKLEQFDPPHAFICGGSHLIIIFLFSLHISCDLTRDNTM